MARVAGAPNMVARTNRILEILIESGKTEVADLAAALNVSQVTMRKDLTELEERGLVRREHGAAALLSPDNVEGRLAYHYNEKLRIARRTIACVHDGDTVMIENGSCCALLAFELARERTGITIITNSAFIADYVRREQGATCVLLGGTYQDDARVCVGPLVAASLADFYVDLLFVGTDGYSNVTGFTNSDQMRAQAVRDMSAHAKRVVVLTESEKFQKRGTVPLALDPTRTTVVTDAALGNAMETELKSKGMDVVTV